MRRTINVAGRRGIRCCPLTALAGGGGGLGSLDLSSGTFTRSSSAMWWDGTAVTSYATDVLREPETDWLAIEGSRTSYVTAWSAFDDNGRWPPTGLTAVTGNDANGPNGLLEAELLEAPGANDFVNQRELNAPENVPVTPSVFMKGVLGGESVHVLMFDRATNITFTTHALTTEWDRYTHTDPDNDITGNNRWRMQSQAAGDWHAWGYCAEPSHFASSPIENTSATASATRSADNLTHATAPSFLQSGKWQVKVRPICNDTDFSSEAATMSLIHFQTTGEYLRLVESTGVKVELSDGVNTTTSSAITFSADQELTITCDMASGDITISGATTGDGTTAGAAAVTFPGTAFRVGADYSGTNPFFGLIEKTISEVA